MTIVRVGTVIDGTGAAPISGAELHIQDGRIARVGKDQIGTESQELVYDYSHLTALPGFIDLHSHFCYPIHGEFQKAEQNPNQVDMVTLGFKAARSWLEQGVTTARVVGTHFDLDFGLRELVAQRPDLGPRIVAAGRMMTMTGGKRTPWDVLKEEVSGAAEARRWSRAHFARGADLVKLYCTTLLEEDVAGYLKRKLALPEDAPDPGRWASLSVEEIRAVADEAHKIGRTVAAHVAPTFGIKIALLGGVDTIDHGSELDDECISLFLKTGATLVPTLSVARPHRREEDSETGKVYAQSARKRWELNSRLVRQAFEAGVKIGTGTDAVMPDMDYWTEVELLVDVGLPPMEALRCGTQRAAACMGDAGKQYGTLQPGNWADMVLIDGDPLADIRNIRRVVSVWKAGRIVASPMAGDKEVAHG